MSIKCSPAKFGIDCEQSLSSPKFSERLARRLKRTSSKRRSREPRVARAGGKKKKKGSGLGSLYVSTHNTSE